MKLWIAPGYADFTKMTKDDEGELAEALANRMKEIGMVVNKILKTKKQARMDFDGPKGRRYTVAGFYSRSRDDADFVQAMGFVADSPVRLDLYVIVPEIDAKVPALLGHLYHDGERNVNIIGAVENRMVGRALKDAFDKR